MEELRKKKFERIKGLKQVGRILEKLGFVLGALMETFV
jgi:hypothetical protein